MKEEQDGIQNIPARKMKFTPRIPPRKATKPTVVKLEKSETKDDILDKELLTKLNRSKANDGFARRFPKNDRKAGPSQIAFGHGSSSLAGSFPKGRVLDGLDTSLSKLEKEYVEPWDYPNSYYPTTLPLRRPYSGNPEILDEEEFREASRSMVVDDGSETNPAEELDLMEKREETKMLLFQFPANLPLSKQTATAKKGSKLEDLQSGFMGKIMVYKSGKVKMKLGDALYDISPGIKCAFSQEVAAINTKEKHCCMLGEIDTRAVVMPDVDALLDSMDDFDLHLL